MKIFFIVVLMFLGSMTEKLLASDAKELVEKLKKTAQPGEGITSREQKIAERVQAAGAAAIPYLLPLLRDDDEEVRALAAYTLSGMEGLAEQHLDDLIESRRRGDGWIPPAIAKVGTPKAAAFLVEELVRERETQTQLTEAIKILGDKAIPRLLHVYQRENEWDDQLEETMFSAFGGLGEHAVAAIDPLIEIANNQVASPKQRMRAITAVGAIGLSAERVVPNLEKLRQHGNKEISSAATSAILNIGSAEAAPILAANLEHIAVASDRMLLMRDIAALKTRGKSAGPAVSKYLNDEDWNIRVGAARALGYIGYEDAADDLAKLLNRLDDWRLVFSAAESLGRLKVGRAIPALQHVAGNHWYPPVREAALKAIEAIRSDSIPTPKNPGENFYFEFFAYEHAGEKMEVLEGADAKVIRFPIDPTQGRPLMVAIKDRDGTMKAMQLPGVNVENGTIVGSNRGEWGGEISFLDSNNIPHVIAKENTEAIYRTAHGVFAVTGLAHIARNNGFILNLSRGADGKWAAAKWRVLPGAPKFSRLLKDGRMLVSCRGGIVLVAEDGDMKSLTRSQVIQRSASRE